MRNVVTKVVLATVLSCACAVIPMRASADEWPLAPGDYWEVGTIHVKDGGALAYAKWVATEWKAGQEFAKSKGWIKGYMVLGNVFARKGEPNLYLITIFERMPTGQEMDKRADEYVAGMKKSLEQMVKETGDRLEFRESVDDLLLQEYKFRK